MFVFLSPTPSGKLNGIDLPQEVKEETEGCIQTARSLTCTESDQRAVTEMKAGEVFMNGSDLQSDEGSQLFTQLKDSR